MQELSAKTAEVEKWKKAYESEHEELSDCHKNHVAAMKELESKTAEVEELKKTLSEHGESFQENANQCIEIKNLTQSLSDARKALSLAWDVVTHPALNPGARAYEKLPQSLVLRIADLAESLAQIEGVLKGERA